MAAQPATAEVLMPKFRKKPVMIEAVQWTGHNWDDVVPWCPMAQEGRGTALVISTLEGDMLANAGDWIIKGVKGEFYPCKPDIFEATYEPVKDGG
jgi:hypothetical protein